MKGKNLQLKTAFRAVMLILMLGSVGIMKGYSVTIGNLNYSLSSNKPYTATVTGHVNGTSATGSVTIPSTVTYNNRTYSVTIIGSYAFRNCSGLTSITIPNSVTTIQYYAFLNCSGLTSITIPNSVTTISFSAFQNCNGLTSITIPESVTSIIDNPFEGCTGLTTIAVASGNTAYDSRNNCNAIIKTSTNELIVGCKQTTFPTTVTSIGGDAFRGCSNLFSITIPESVTSITNNPFAGCTGLYYITVASGNTVYDSRFNSNAIIKTNTNELIAGCRQTDIPNSVTSIGDNAFAGCRGLLSITIPNSVTHIGRHAFNGCAQLTEVTIGEGVTTIDYGAFWNCPLLTTVHFNAIHCSNMPGWDDENDIDQYESVFSPDNSVPAITTLTIGENVQYIPDLAFKDCSNISGNLVIPSSVTTIGAAFYGCSNISSITFNSNPVLYYCAFNNCTGVSSITINSENAPVFFDEYSSTMSGINNNIPIYVPCGKATTFSIKYGWNVFYNFQEQNMHSLSVSSNDNYKGTAEITQEATCSDNAIVTAIPNAGVFQNWTEGGEVVSTDNPYSFELTSDRNLVANFVPVEIIEGDYKYTVDLVTGEASVKANNTSVTTSSFATSITYQSTDYPVTSIAKNGFKDCISITEMIIPNSIITIESGAFSRCRFTKVVIPSSVTSIGQQAFFNCISLSEVIFEDGLALITLYNNKYSDGIGGGLFENCPVAKAYIGRNIAVSNYYDSYDRPWTNAPFSRWTSGVYAPLSEVILGNNVTKLCDYFFEKCNAITSIVSCIDHPASMTMGTGVFRQVPTSTCVLYVPAGSLGEYQSTAQWSDFSNIQTIAYVTISGYGSSTESDKWAFIASPLADDVDPEDIDGLIATTSADFDLYQLNSAATNEWENWKQTGDHYHFNLVNGKGYLYANRNDVNIILQGDMFTGDYKDVTLQTGWNLVGNPYAQLAYINRSYYKMNAAGDDIEAVSAYTTTAIPICTGVVVQGASNADVVRFTKTAPSKSTGNGGLQMTLVKAGNRGNEVQDKAIVIFEENVQLGKYIFNENHAKLYIPQNGNDYAIAYSDGQHAIPLYFRTKEMGTYTINFNNDTEFGNVYLVDKFEGAVIDLSVCSSYTFIGSSADRPDRFELVFGSPTESEADNFAYQSGNEIIVNGDGELQVFDVMGRMVTKLYVNGIEMIAKPSVNGVYIFRLNEKTQKIVVK